MKEFIITIIIPVFNEGKQIARSIQTINDILKKTDINYEFILIDDGSKDDTWQVIKEISSKGPRIKAIKLSRNFGKEAAICAGLEKFNGEACILIDADLQHPPELIPEMIRLWKDEGYDIVEGIKASRGKERLINSLGAKIFYYMLNKLSCVDLNKASDFKLLDSKVVQAWRKMGEYNVFFRGMAAWLGYKKVSIPFEVKERVSGKSKWSFFNLFKLATNAITAFSTIPLQIITVLGLILLAFSFFLGLQTLYMKISGRAFSGFTTVILLQLMIGSSIMIALGIIGTYVSRIYEEVKMRPRYLVAEIFENKKISRNNVQDD